MRAFFFWAAAFLTAAFSFGQGSLLLPPEYSAAGIVNAASQRAERLAPNTILTIYGKNLSHATWALSAGEIRNGQLPTDVPGLNVIVKVRGVAIPLYYVAPTQINALIPARWLPGPARLEVVRGALSGAPVELFIGDEAPDLFQFDGNRAAATDASGHAVTNERPATPGKFVVLYGTGWGAVVSSGQQQQDLAPAGAALKRMSEIRVRFGERELQGADIFYAGLTPGFAGLYQVNFKVPEDATGLVDVSLKLGEAESGVKVRLPVAGATNPMP